MTNRKQRITIELRDGGVEYPSNIVVLDVPAGDDVRSIEGVLRVLDTSTSIVYSFPLHNVLHVKAVELA